MRPCGDAVVVSFVGVDAFLWKHFYVWSLSLRFKSRQRRFVCWATPPIRKGGIPVGGLLCQSSRRVSAVFKGETFTFPCVLTFLCKKGPFPVRLLAFLVSRGSSWMCFVNPFPQNKTLDLFFGPAAENEKGHLGQLFAWKKFPKKLPPHGRSRAQKWDEKGTIFSNEQKLSQNANFGTWKMG